MPSTFPWPVCPQSVQQPRNGVVFAWRGMRPWLWSRVRKQPLWFFCCCFFFSSVYPGCCLEMARPFSVQKLIMLTNGPAFVSNAPAGIPTVHPPFHSRGSKNRSASSIGGMPFGRRSAIARPHSPPTSPRAPPRGPYVITHVHRDPAFWVSPPWPAPRAAFLARHTRCNRCV